MSRATPLPCACRVGAWHPRPNRRRVGALHPRPGVVDTEQPVFQSRPRGRFGADRHCPGWSLVEVVVASLIAGIMLVGAMLTLSAALRSALAASRSAQAAALAKELMEEILQASYRDPDGNPIWGIEEPSGTNRSMFDDVDDYAGWAESPPQMRDGTPMDWLSGWQREVSVTNVDPNDLGAALPTTDDRGVRQIRVVVKYQGQTLAQLTGLKTSAPLVPTSPLTNDRTTAAKPPGNQAPRAVARGSPLSGAGQVTVQFDATASRDPEGDGLTFAWDFGDGQMGTGPSPSHTYANADMQTKVFTAVLTVGDTSGARATDRITVVVFPAQP